MWEIYMKSLARLNIIESDKYWQKLVDTDYEGSILFPGNYDDSRFDNNDIPFVYVKIKTIK